MRASISASFFVASARKALAWSLTVPVATHVDQVVDLLAAESKTLCHRDDPQGRHGVVAVDAVCAEAAIGFGDQATTLVAPQRLPADPRRTCNLPGAKPGVCPRHESTLSDVGLGTTDQDR